MGQGQYFPQTEYDRRLNNLRRLMAERDIDACLISSPENIFYLSGLSHMGFFATHLLIVPRDGKMALICRAMEQVTVEKLVLKPGRANFYGYADSDEPVRFTCEVLRQMGLAAGRLAMEKSSLFLSPRIPEGISAQLTRAHLGDCSGMIDKLRQIKSEQEVAYIRQAAQVSDVMMRAARETAIAGVSEQEIAAEVHRAMLLAGGTYPGFSPFIRATPTLGEEHRTWSDHVLQPGEALFVELSGCIKRYHAPMGRLIYIGSAPIGTEAMVKLCLDAFHSIVSTIRPGVTAGRVYQAWQDVVDAAGLSHYRRHHCGYMTGIGFPPSWVGGSSVVGLRYDSNLEIQAGMVFHLMSWLMGAGQGDYFVSDTAVVTEDGCEVVTGVSQELYITS
ncbi:MAG: Xaa-Pro peptidase family protein [Chloroflexota bacterium]